MKLFLSLTLTLTLLVIIFQDVQNFYEFLQYFLTKSDFKSTSAEFLEPKNVYLGKISLQGLFFGFPSNTDVKN